MRPRIFYFYEFYVRKPPGKSNCYAVDSGGSNSVGVLVLNTFFELESDDK